MIKISYSKLEEHKNIHQKFLKEIVEIINEYNEQGSYKKVQLYIFLIKWLQTHIAVEDQKYVLEKNKK